MLHIFHPFIFLSLSLSNVVDMVYCKPFLKRKNKFSGFRCNLLRHCKAIYDSVEVHSCFECFEAKWFIYPNIV